MWHKGRGEHETEEGTRYTAALAEVEALIEDWPEAPKTEARRRTD